MEEATGIWRCGGRLGNSDLSYDAQYPILLPRGHQFTLLVIRRAHQRVLHSGVKDTLTEIRSRYWIPRGRGAVRQFIGRCVRCRRYSGSSYVPPPPPPLPEFRVQQSFPFSAVGVDYAGPLMIKQNTHTSYKVGRHNTHTACNEKAWLCMFTCCVTRAVHIDVVTDLSSYSFLQCFKRFIARRGLPSKIISDNGSTFKSASKILSSILEHPEVKEFMSGNRVKWIFNVERAPWWGGFFERMIQVLKRCLRKLVGQAKLTYQELLTSVAEVELIVNSRPLTYMSPLDLEEPLTPSHLIFGKRLMSLPDNFYYAEPEDFNPGLSHLNANKRLRYLHTVLDHFWNRWRREYLTEFRENHRRSKKESCDDVAIGDVVIIHDDVQQGLWKLGLIESKITGKDGQTRGAVVRVRSGQGTSAFYRRPLQRLYPLEVRQEELSDTSKRGTNAKSTTDTISNDAADVSNNFDSLTESTGVDEYSGKDFTGETPTFSNGQEGVVKAHPVSVPDSTVTRPQRRAAREARDRIVAQLMDN